MPYQHTIIKKGVYYRSACQVANMGVSLLLLGLIIPIFLRKNTEKKHAEDIKKALEDEKFLVYYQPIVSKNNDEINLFSAEALIRWRRQGEMLNPRTFLKIADKYNLICKIDLFVLKTVCIRPKSWIDEGLNPVCIHCNFADSDLLTENLADSIINIIPDFFSVYFSPF